MLSYFIWSSYSCPPTPPSEFLSFLSKEIQIDYLLRGPTPTFPSFFVFHHMLFLFFSCYLLNFSIVHYTLVQNTIGPSSACCPVFRVFVPGKSPDARVRLPMPDLCVSFVGACSVRNILCCSLLGRTNLELARPGSGRLMYAEWALAGETRGSGAGVWVRASLVSLGADMCIF